MANDKESLDMESNLGLPEGADSKVEKPKKKPRMQIIKKAVAKEEKPLVFEAAPKPEDAVPPKKTKPKIFKTSKTPMAFSNTVFTDRNKSEIARYKRYHESLQKKEIGAVKKAPVRYNPNISSGLNEEQVNKRVMDGNTNFTKRGSTKTIGRILFTNIFTFFNILCFTVGGVLLWIILTEDPSAWANIMFLFIILANVGIGIYQEIKAKMIIEKLSLLASSKVKVVRGGEEMQISVDDVVLDDIIMLTNGQQVCADCVVVDGVVEANESLLTGESNPIQKNVGGKVLSGSFIVSGSAHVRAEKVGKDCYIQTLAKNASHYARPKSELLGSLRLIIKIITVILVPLAILLFFTHFLDNGQLNFNFANDDTKRMFYKVSGAIIGMIPAGMFLLTSVALFVGVIKLAKSNTLVQELYCIEMLARVDTLCLDKTGTITDGTMKVCDVVEVKNTSDYTIRELVASMLWALNDNNQTAIALANHFDRNGIIKALRVLPFSSNRKLSAVTFEGEGTYVIGAPEFVLKERFEKVDEKIARFASQGYRVLMLGRASGVIKDNRIPDGVKPVAIITIQDHIRPEAPKTIEWFKNNGVDVRVISGDNPVTVSEVARRAGIVNADRYISLEGMSNVEVRAIANAYTVFGRVSPEQKLILIKELKQSGRKVAMTGDGVNDILALREADCSIAMAAGSEAARNVSHLVLMDGNFASMPKVVMEGRRVVNNVQKLSSLFLFKTILSMMLAIFVVCLGIEYIFEPRNLLLLEFFIIGAPSLFLAIEVDDRQIKGKFILNILKSACVAAFVAFISIVALYILEAFQVSPFFMTSSEFHSLAIYITTIVGVLLLYKITQPLNIYRGILFCAVVIGIILGVTYLPMLGFSPIGSANLLLLIVMAQAAYPLMALFNYILSKTRIPKQAEK